MRKTALAVALASILIAAAAGTFFINLALANPYSHVSFVDGGNGSPPPDTKPPKFSVLSPEHNSTFNPNSVSINFTVEVGESKSADPQSLTIESVYYKADWLENYTYIYEYIPDSSVYSSPAKTEFSNTLNLTGIPEGRHSIILYAKETGKYFEPSFSEVPMWSLNSTVTYYSFDITGVSPVSFTVDATPLTVSVLPIENKAIAESALFSVPLNFTTSEVASKISYVLDGHDNITIAGNTTLAGLPVGAHNITIYAWDAAGNIGVSDTITFTLAKPESFPVVPVVAAVSVVTALFICAGLVVYFRKRSHKTLLQKN